MKLLADYPTLHRTRCERGHEGFFRRPPESCPNYVRGVPCNKPVRIERRAKR